MAVATREHRGKPTDGQHSGERTGDSRRPERVRTERDVDRADHTNIEDEQEKRPADEQHLARQQLLPCTTKCGC